VGPAFVAESHPLAGLSGRLNGICLDGRFVRDLYYSGPGAGPDVTAATLLDDAVEILSGETGADPAAPAIAAAADLQAPETPWFVRLAFAAQPPCESDLCDLLGAHGIWPRRMSGPAGSLTYLITQRCAKTHLDAGLAALSAATGARTHAVRVLEA
jgi:hypothetical protein